MKRFRSLLLAALTPVLIAPILVAALPCATHAQEGVFLTEEQAPAAVFPDATAFSRRVVSATPEVRAQMRTLLGSTEPSIWEPEYVSVTAKRGDVVLGSAIIVEEIGKHRPISFVVGVRPDGRVNDVAVMAYREAYGGEVKRTRFLAQYRGKSAANTLRTPSDITNIAGATLSVEAASRAVKKALAVAHVALGFGGAE